MTVFHDVSKAAVEIAFSSN